MAQIPFDPNEIDRAIDEALEFIVKEVSKSVHRTVVLASPVGDPTLWQNPDNAPPGYVGGTFRSNWQVGVGSAPGGEVGIEPVSATLAKGAVKIEAEVVDTRKSVFVVNNLPYANRLNNGWSTQAPAGFIEQAIAQGVAGAITGRREL